MSVSKMMFTGATAARPATAENAMHASTAKRRTAFMVGGEFEVRGSVEVPSGIEKIDGHASRVGTGRAPRVFLVVDGPRTSLVAVFNHRMSAILIREAVDSDVAELARLTSQLGYPVSPDLMRTRLARMQGREDVCFLVAEAASGELRGWIHGFLCQLPESDYRVEIGGLVVDEARRRCGIGRRLVAAVAAWAARRGAAEISVRCREDRMEAHRFYERLSFRPVKTQRVFRRRLDEA